MEKPKADEATHRLDLGQPLQVDRQRIGNLVLHHLRRTAGVIGEDDHLVVGQVRDGIHRGPVGRPDTPRR